MTKKENNNEEKDLTTQGQGQAPPTESVDLTADLEKLSGFKAGKGEQITGLESLDRSDLKLPKIKLVQSTSLEAQKNKSQAGHFYNTITGDSYEKLNCYLLALGKSRIMWKKPFKRGEDPLCWSSDGVHKHDGTQLCTNCKYQDWNQREPGESKPPCNMSYVWLGVTASDKAPFRLIASGSSVSPTKDFLNTIAPKKYPPYVYQMTLTSEQRENESGVFFVINYNIKGTVPNAEEANKLKELSIGMKDMFMKAIEKDAVNTEAAEEEATSKEQEEQNSLF